jgi:hypothetical protein
MRAFLRFALLPLLGYIACYFILSFPLLFSWRTAYFCDTGDGAQMVWNVWWVKYSLLHLHQLPWHTNMLFYPGGVSLLLDSLTPINGLIGIALSGILPPVQVYNTLVTLAFSLSGLTAFWLAYDATRAYWPSLAAGYAFAFCSFRFAHAGGHLHQISSEFMPLFLLFWLMLLRKPTPPRALAAAMTLFLVLLSDHYLFVFCVLAAVVFAIWQLLHDRAWQRWRNRQSVIALFVFVIVASCTSGPLLAATLRESISQTDTVFHDPQFFSADLTNLFIPGWSWCFHSLTRPIWEPVGSYVETSVSIGIAVLIAAVAGFACRRRLKFSSAGMWASGAIVFAAFSLGPTLRIFTISITQWMPYRLLETFLPPLKLGGCPARMMVVCELCCAILAAAGLKSLEKLTSGRQMFLAVIFILAMVLESEPRTQPTLPATIPRWVEFLRDSPKHGALLDLLHRSQPLGTYFQTLHQRPMAFGYTSRPNPRAAALDSQIADFAEHNQFQQLGKMGFAFIVVGASHAPLQLPIAFQDASACVYQIDPFAR